jgi:hypothetical protein
MAATRFLWTMKFGSGERKNHRVFPQATICTCLNSVPISAILKMNAITPVGLLRRAFFFGAKMTDADILMLVDRFERCLLGKEEFPHRDHLTVAVVYLYASDLETAMDRMRGSLKRFAAHHRVTGLYHETLTQFWLEQVVKCLDRRLCLSESVKKVKEQLNDKNLIFEYYTRERIDSKEARESWLQPDLNAGMRI